MDCSCGWVCLAVTFCLTLNLTECCPTDKDGSKDQRCIEALEAIDHLYENLPVGVSLQEKCKRYAILSTLIVSRGQARHKAALFVSKLAEVELTLLCHRIDQGELVKLYTNLVEVYRAGGLRPPFLELIECLGQIDMPSAKAYLQSRELILIAKIYRHILLSPLSKIDIDSIDLSQYRPGFETTLRNTFRDYLTAASKGGIGSSRSEVLNQQNLQPQKVNSAVSRFQMTIRQQERQRRLRDEAKLTAEEPEDIWRQRRREKNRERVRKLRQEDPERCREQERLRQQRLRIVKPDHVRAGERRRQKRRRARIREESRQPTAEQQLSGLHIQSAQDPEQQPTGLSVESQSQRQRQQNQKHLDNVQNESPVSSD